MVKELEHFLQKYQHNHYQLMFKLLKVYFFYLIKKYLNNSLARDGSRSLQRLSTEQRKIIINKMASNLIDYSKDILQENKRDLEDATKGGKYLRII
jgi:hypothetical protein